MQNERRRHPRIVIACPARVFDNHGRLLVRGKTVDIGASGVRILGPMVKEPKPGTQVDVEIDLVMPDSDKLRKIQRSATIRRVEALGEWTAVALEFGKVVDV